MIAIHNSGQIVKFRVTPKLVIECDHAQIRNCRVTRIDTAAPSIHADLFFGVIEDGRFVIPAGMETAAAVLTLALHDNPGRDDDPAGANYPPCTHVADILASPPIAGVSSFKQVGIAIEIHLTGLEPCSQCGPAGYKLDGEVIFP